MLKDNTGRTVILQEYGNSCLMKAKDGLNLIAVDEAIVCKGDDVFPSVEFIRNALDTNGFDWVTFTFDRKETWRPINVKIIEHREGYWYSYSSRDKKYNICGRIVDSLTCTKIDNILNDLRKYCFLTRGETNTTPELEYMSALEIIGVGNVVTVDSLMQGCAKGESRMKFMEGDYVKFGQNTSVILKMGKKANILRKDGKKVPIEYSRLERTTDLSIDTSVTQRAEKTIVDNMTYVFAQSNHIYRAKTEIKDVVYPKFPKPRYSQTELKNVQTCVCPSCGDAMAQRTGYWSKNKTFTCCACELEGRILKINSNEVSLLLGRQQAKNRFAIKEVRSCANCGNFHFKSGRQGKRSTGYCETSNQCVQSFNTCNYWFPNTPERYGKALTQHITNLGYGVTDSDDIVRGNTAYTKEDHLKEKARADLAKKDYSQLYVKFIDDLTKLADEKPLHEGPLDEAAVEEWKKVLTEEC